VLPATGEHSLLTKEILLLTVLLVVANKKCTSGCRQQADSMPDSCSLFEFPKLILNTGYM